MLIGVAAGLVKDMTTANVFLGMAVPFVEVGTFTFDPCAGHPEPRIVRDGRTLRNRMGFPNPGILAFLDDLNRNPPVG